MKENFSSSEKELLEAGERGEIDRPELLCLLASLLHRTGKGQAEARPLLQALNHLMHASELAPELFEASSPWLHLWANVLVSLSDLTGDLSFLEQALAQFDRAQTGTAPFFQEWGEAWLALAHRSGELSDLKEGLAKFAEGERQGESDAPFIASFATGLLALAKHTGDPSHVEAALSRLHSHMSEPEAAVTYALACKIRFELTHLEAHFGKADVAMREAILAVPSAAYLWLEWGELHLTYGWVSHDVTLVEEALEKFSSMKVQEADPLRLASLIGRAFLFMGLYHEDLKLLSEGKTRIDTAFDIAPHSSEPRVATALRHFAYGFYFSDAKEFAAGALLCEQGLEEDNRSIDDWRNLSQIYINWGLGVGEVALVQRGVDAIARLATLRPHSPLYRNNWGNSLLRLKELEKSRKKQEALIEEAILRFQEALALSHEVETLYNLGCAYDMLGEVTGDLEAYQKAIEILAELHKELPFEKHICYQLAVALSHFAELTADAESLYYAIELFEALTDAEPEDAGLECELGYALLTLSQLIEDEGAHLRQRAEKALLLAAQLGNHDAYYHLACLYSLAGLMDASLNFIKRADEGGALPSLEDLAHDEWLEDLRQTEAFQDFLNGQ